MLGLFHTSGPVLTWGIPNAVTRAQENILIPKLRKRQLVRSITIYPHEILHLSFWFHSDRLGGGGGDQ